MNLSLISRTNSTLVDVYPLIQAENLNKLTNGLSVGSSLRQNSIKLLNSVERAGKFESNVLWTYYQNAFVSF